MKWSKLLREELEPAYKAAEGLMDLVDDSMLDWKPESGSNWMTTGQLLKHITEACGLCFKGFVTGAWEFPGAEVADIPPDQMLPPAEVMASVSSVAEAKQLLATDKEVAIAMLDRCEDDRLENEKSTAPWGGPQTPLGQHLLHMIAHLDSHKAQLFYYLKLQGKPVNTFNLYGM